jgi:hypothetical protein
VEVEALANACHISSCGKTAKRNGDLTVLSRVIYLARVLLAISMLLYTFYIGTGFGRICILYESNPYLSIFAPKLAQLDPHDVSIYKHLCITEMRYSRPYDYSNMGGSIYSPPFLNI